MATIVGHQNEMVDEPPQSPQELSSLMLMTTIQPVSVSRLILRPASSHAQEEKLTLTYSMVYMLSASASVYSYALLVRVRPFKTIFIYLLFMRKKSKRVKDNVFSTLECKNRKFNTLSDLQSKVFANGDLSTFDASLVFLSLNITNVLNRPIVILERSGQFRELLYDTNSNSLVK